MNYRIDFRIKLRMSEGYCFTAYIWWCELMWFYFSSWRLPLFNFANFGEFIEIFHNFGEFSIGGDVFNKCLRLCRPLGVETFVDMFVETFVSATTWIFINFLVCGDILPFCGDPIFCGDFMKIQQKRFGFDFLSFPVIKYSL